jgi:exosome complex RNA-binding protein Rrp4
MCSVASLLLEAYKSKLWNCAECILHNQLHAQWSLYNAVHVSNSDTFLSLCDLLVPAGDLVYARVVTANRDMDPVLSCVDSSGRAAGFGPLKGGLVVECSLPHARTLLAKPPGPVLAALGSKMKFELAVGLNGRLWVNSVDCRTTIRVCRVLVGAQNVPVAEQQQWVVQQLHQ